jgi:hypothetical protein
VGAGVLKGENAGPTVNETLLELMKSELEGEQSTLDATPQSKEVRRGFWRDPCSASPGVAELSIVADHLMIFKTRAYPIHQIVKSHVAVTRVGRPGD